MHRGKFGHFSNTFENKFVNLKGDDSQEEHEEIDLVIEFVLQHLQNKDPQFAQDKNSQERLWHILQVSD